ncbi:MAG: ParB N-terminal domain-containing protein [Thermoplasmataceae archaeon]|jgi:hypothetical protein
MTGPGNEVLKEELKNWIKEHNCKGETFQEGTAPLNGKLRGFALTTCPLNELVFNDHKFNPRTPNQGKVKELAASISVLTLLTPLTCAYIEENEERVVLLDGRHRFSALQSIAQDHPDWAINAKVDLKIYYNLEKSDVYMLATYLNKTRRALHKGEYYQFIVDIYDSKYEELVRKNGKEPTEAEIFREISARELTNKNSDLSVGRIVGQTAFDDEQNGSWYPFVGSKQQDRIKMGKYKEYFCPITAGNMAKFLEHLCQTTPYNDNGEKRAVEITNVLELGQAFTEEIFKEPVKKYDKATGTTVACKHWVIDALGYLLENNWSKAFLKNGDQSGSFLSHPEIDWDSLKKFLRHYLKVMETQATLTNKYRSTENRELVENIWSYQTQTMQIVPRLQKEMEDEFSWLKQ